MWKARNSSSRFAMRFLIFLDVRIIYIIISWGCIRWLPITLVCVVHNDVCFVCVLGLAMVYGELQRLRSDGSSRVVVDLNRMSIVWWTLTVGYDPFMVIEVCAPAMCFRCGLDFCRIVPLDDVSVRWFEFLLLRWRWMMHMTCAFFDVCNFLSTGHGVFSW